MFEPDDDLIARVVRQLRRPIEVDPAIDGRVMTEVSRLPLRRKWLSRPRMLLRSPLRAFAIAAALAAVLFTSYARWVRSARVPPLRSVETGTGGEAMSAAQPFGFVVVAPHAGRVSLVGDFNDWDAARTPMQRTPALTAAWTTVVPLAPGRYRYAFLVDGVQWLADPRAPAVRDDEFGRPSSVVTVGGS